MTFPLRVGLSLYAAVALGLAVSTGYPAGIVAGIVMPIACMVPTSRRSAFATTFGYHAAGLWPMIPGAKHFTGQSAPILIATLMWVCAAMLLSIPWTLAWLPNGRLQYLWRVALAEIAGILPPLGLVGFISPLTGAGYLFPGTGWAGLIATSLLPGIVLAFARSTIGRSRVCLCVAFSAVIALSVGSHCFNRQEAKPPANWEAVNTNFGDLSRPFQDFVAAQSIQERVAASPARVVIFPEFVVPRWSNATVAFWQQTLDGCRTRGQPFAIARQLETRIDADAPHIGKIIHKKTGEIARLLGGAQRAEGFLQGLFRDLREARPLGQKSASDNAQGQAWIATLQKPDGRFDRLCIAISVIQKMCNGRRHDRASTRSAGAVQSTAATVQ